MTPMPPTISDTSAMEASSVVRVCVAEVSVPVISAMLRVEKSSSSSGASRCRSRSSEAICARAASMASLETALT